MLSSLSILWNCFIITVTSLHFSMLGEEFKINGGSEGGGREEKL